MVFGIKDMTDGAVAQMGERMTGSHEVRGSIPLSSTKNITDLADRAKSFFLVWVVC
jgi:hypothetical protein